MKKTDPAPVVPQNNKRTYQSRIVQYLDNFPEGLTKTHITQGTGIPISKVHNAVDRLYRKGVLRHSGKKGNAFQYALVVGDPVPVKPKSPKSPKINTVEAQALDSISALLAQNRLLHKALEDITNICKTTLEGE